MRLRPALVLLFLCAHFAALPALAGQLTDLPWDDKTPQEVRSGVRSALWKESSELSKQTNEAGKKYISVFTNEAVEPAGDKMISYLTIQRCLDDKMVTERWRYTLAKKGKDYEIVDRTKVHSIDDSLHTGIENLKKAKPSKGFSFEHDLLSLKVEAGSYVATLVGDKPSSFHISAKGHVTIKPLNDYEKMFYERKIKKDIIDTDISAVEITFHPDDTVWHERVGHGAGAAGSGEVTSVLREMYDKQVKNTQDKEYTPYVYSTLPRPEYRGYFTLRLKTNDLGWVTYSFSPTDVKEISIFRETAKLSLRTSDVNGDLISFYPAPETRALPLLQQEHRRGLRWVEPIRYNGMFDVDSDRFTALVDVDIRGITETNEVYFGLGGNPKVRFVKGPDGSEYPFVPFLSEASRIYGFEETANTYRVVFPKPLKPGEEIRLTIAFESPKVVQMISSGVWWIDRFGFLPFAGALSDPAYMQFIIRTKDIYNHIAIGSKLEEELSAGYRYTRWGADRMFNFPTMIIGQYFDPVVLQADGVKITGYMAKSTTGGRQFGEMTTMQLPTMSRDDMIPEAEQAANSIRLFGQLFKAPYPFKDLKLVGMPAESQAGYAQSPTSIVYIGEDIFWPDAFLASWGGGGNPAAYYGVTAHEVSHQWWGGQVNNINPFHYWFVETLAQISTALHDEALKPRQGYKMQLEHWRQLALNIDWQAAVQDSYRAEDGLGYQGLVYYKGPYVVHMLGEYFGQEKVIEFMQNLMKDHGDDLVSTVDIQRTAERTVKTDLSWFFDDWIRGVGIPEVSYQFDEIRQAENGKWIISGKLRQEIKVKGKTIPGRYFKNLLVPMTVTPVNGNPIKAKVLMEGPEKDFNVSVDEKPKGTPVLNANNTMLITVKEM